MEHFGEVGGAALSRNFFARWLALLACLDGGGVAGSQGDDVCVEQKPVGCMGGQIIYVA